ncbi:MAG: hypothetical protein LC776_08505, partial [Acidobacteria bacterium]|nr:hypothetical protein [Acidobacteriota bacterium]
MEEFSERLEVFARENNEVGTVSIRHAQRLAAGEWTADQLRPATTRLLENFFESPIDELLVSPEAKVSDKNEPEAEIKKPIGESHIRHPVDGRLMAKVDGSVFLSGPGNEPIWLPTFYIDVHPVANAEYARFIAATGH